LDVRVKSRRRERELATSAEVSIRWRSTSERFPTAGTPLPARFSLAAELTRPATDRNVAVGRVKKEINRLTDLGPSNLFRVDDSRNSSTAGVGLGLAISKANHLQPPPKNPLKNY
jgi:hypothetical protein